VEEGDLGLRKKFQILGKVERMAKIWKNSG